MPKPEAASKIREAKRRLYLAEMAGAGASYIRGLKKALAVITKSAALSPSVTPETPAILLP